MHDYGDTTSHRQLARAARGFATHLLLSLLEREAAVLLVLGRTLSIQEQVDSLCARDRLLPRQRLALKRQHAFRLLRRRVAELTVSREPSWDLRTTIRIALWLRTTIRRTSAGAPPSNALVVGDIGVSESTFVLVCVWHALCGIGRRRRGVSKAQRVHRGQWELRRAVRRRLGVIRSEKQQLTTRKTGACSSWGSVEMKEHSDSNTSASRAVSRGRAGARAFGELMAFFWSVALCCVERVAHEAQGANPLCPSPLAFGKLNMSREMLGFGLETGTKTPLTSSRWRLDREWAYGFSRNRCHSVQETRLHPLAINKHGMPVWNGASMSLHGVSEAHGQVVASSEGGGPSSPTIRRGEAFLAQCEADKQALFASYRKQVLRSLRRWEKQQLLEKTMARAGRLANMKAENHDKLMNSSVGARTYNLKSIRQAATQGDIDRLVELLALGFDANASSAMGLTPLLAACQSGCLEAVRVLVRAGADVNLAHVKTKRTPLMEANARESVDVVRELLRFGARLDLRDMHGETAFDGVRDPEIGDAMQQASSTWSRRNAALFPTPFRAACQTLLLIQSRQQTQQQQRRAAMRRELSMLCPKFVRTAAEAKMRYDALVRTSLAQTTLLKKVDVLMRAAEQLGNEWSELLRAVDKAVLMQADADQHRVLSMDAIERILAYCSRHWFDPVAKKAKQRKKRQTKHSCVSQAVVTTRLRVGLEVLPRDVDLVYQSALHALKEACEELQRVQTDELPDVPNGITRRRDGTSLARLFVQVVEAQHLAYRDPRTLEKSDPFVRVRIDEGPASEEWLVTEIRLGERSPSWEAAFAFVVESIHGTLRIQVVDAKRQEVIGESSIKLRSLLDQKEHGEWLVLPPTLRQQALEKSPRLNPARILIRSRLVHNESILHTRDVNQLLKRHDDAVKQRRAFLDARLHEAVTRLSSNGN